MPEAVSARLKGTESVRKAYTTVTEGAGDMASLQQSIANLIVPSVRGTAPVRSGTLRGSIGASALPNNLVRLSVGVVYGGVIEWGWRVRGISGQHYTARGVMSQQTAIRGLYEQELTKLCATAQAGG